MSLKPLIFKFAVFTIAISSILLVKIEKQILRKYSNSQENNDIIPMIIVSFISLKVIGNIFLSIVCMLSRTRFDLIDVPEFFDRFVTSYAVLTLLLLVGRQYMYNMLSEEVKILSNAEIYFIPVLSFFTLTAYICYTPMNTKSIYK
jgi:hypothetical protein